jgi:hypothetical protein
MSNMTYGEMSGKSMNYIRGRLFVNPTGGKVRIDAQGDGHFGAPRGARLHDGLDFAGEPGQDVLMPVDGWIVRVSFPYATDLRWKGAVIANNWITIKMWYFTMQPDLQWGPEGLIPAGDPIGSLQDLGQKYPGMTPHVHMRITKIDPAILFNT